MLRIDAIQTLDTNARPRRLPDEKRGPAPLESADFRRMMLRPLFVLGRSHPPVDFVSELGVERQAGSRLELSLSL